MVEKQVIYLEKEIIIEEKIDPAIFRKHSSATSFAGYLIGCMKKAKNEGNLNTLFSIYEIYKKYVEFHKLESVPIIEIEILEGWKGKDNLDFYRGFENDFIIASHNKDKETGKVTTTTHTIKRENVNRLLFYIKKWKIGESHECYDFAETIGEKDWQEVWKKRMDVYFPLYYLPIKILEALKIIKYSGRGVITRIK